MGVVPMVEEYLFIKENFMNKCNKLTSFSLRRILILGFLEYEKLKEFADRTGKFDDLLAKLLSGGVRYPHTPCRNGPDFYLNLLCF